MTRSRTAALVVFASLAGAPRAAHAGDKYSLEDLKALGASNSWAELLAHALDVKPSERNDEWKKLTEKAAVARISEAGKKDVEKQPTEVISDIDNLATVMPHLGKAPGFLKVRAEVAPKAWSWCYADHYCRGEDDRAWRDKVEAYVAKYPDDRELAFALGKAVEIHLVAYCAIPMFNAAFEGGKLKSQCKDPGVKKAVDSAATRAMYAKETKAIASACGLVPNTKSKD